MSLSIGIVGLPNSGKSTLFNALTRAGSPVADYPFTTTEPHIGVVAVPDERLSAIAKIVKPEQVTPSTIRFVDIAGLVKGASQGEGLGNQFLGHIRDVDAIAVTIRCFRDPRIPHMYGELDPKRDIEGLNVELCLADIQWLEKRLARVDKTGKAGDKEAQAEYAVLQRLSADLDQGRPARIFVSNGDAPRQSSQSLSAPQSRGLREPERAFLQGLDLLTIKPVVYVANVDEEALAEQESPLVEAVRQQAVAENAEAVVICAKLEDELNDLPDEDAVAYLAALKMPERGLAKLISASYRLLDLATFFTATGQKEVRAWAIPRGTRAVQAAGKVHSDMERGFIRTEVIFWPDLVRAGSFAAAREHGLIHVEGRDYIIQDGEVVHFRFHV